MSTTQLSVQLEGYSMSVPSVQAVALYLATWVVQTGLRRLVKGEGDFALVFQQDDQANVREQVVARVNKYSRQLKERADKELDLMPFPS